MAQPKLGRNALTAGVALAVVLGVWCNTCDSAEARWFEKALIGMEVGPTGAQFGADPRDTG